MRRSVSIRGWSAALVTTLCSTAAVLALAGEPVDEATLVHGFLASEPVVASLRAADRAADARGVATVTVANPELRWRHEEAAGQRTDVIGGAVTVDLGFSAASAGRAARLRGEAVGPWTRAALVDQVCSFRRDVVSLWEAAGSAEVIEEAHDRLHDLRERLARMAEVGEVAAWDRDRAALADTAHQVELASALGRASTLRIGLSARAGVPVDIVALAPLEPPADRAGTLESVRSEHPELVALRLEEAAAERAVVAARGRAAPDLRLEGGARVQSAAGAPASPGFEVGAAIELPVVNQGRAAARGAAAEVERLQALRIRREAEIVASVEAAWERRDVAIRLSESIVDAQAIWAAAQARYAGGEASIDDLLQAANDVEEAELAVLATLVLQRRADLDLQCALGRFTDPAIQSALDEALR